MYAEALQQELRPDERQDGGQQHAEMNVSFDFSTVEAELDRAEEEVERRGGRVRQNSRS